MPSKKASRRKDGWAIQIEWPKDELLLDHPVIDDNTRCPGVSEQPNVWRKDRRRDAYARLRKLRSHGMKCRIVPINYAPVNIHPAFREWPNYPKCGPSILSLPRTLGLGDCADWKYPEI